MVYFRRVEPGLKVVGVGLCTPEFTGWDSLSLGWRF